MKEAHFIVYKNGRVSEALALGSTTLRQDQAFEKSEESGETVIRHLTFRAQTPVQEKALQRFIDLSSLDRDWQLYEDSPAPLASVLELLLGQAFRAGRSYERRQQKKRR